MSTGRTGLQDRIDDLLLGLCALENRQSVVCSLHTVTPIRLLSFRVGTGDLLLVNCTPPHWASTSDSLMHAAAPTAQLPSTPSQSSFMVPMQNCTNEGVE